MSLPPLWPHQSYGVEAYFDALILGHRRILLTSPTGGGKTRTVAEIVRRYVANGKRVAWHTNRKMLLEQTAVGLDELGLTAGKRASGHFAELHHNLQLCSVQTERARTLKGSKWEIHKADLAVFDEAHLQANDTAARLMGKYLDNGAVILGVTATPIDLGDFYDTLIVAGTNSELRECGALVRAEHFGPDEPDLKQIGSYQLGEDVSEEKNRKLMGSVEDGGTFKTTDGFTGSRMTPDNKIKALFGRIIDWWNRLNPVGGKRTLGFAPGVRESLWLAMQFHESGVPAAHIDGEDVWVDGELHRSDKRIREEVIRDFKRGIIRVLWNRFVLREGIDIPEVQHMILACVIGSLQSYIQIGGRGLRVCKYTGKDRCVVQDHGGCLDTETEILTARGWVDYKGIQDSDSVAAFDRFNGSIRWCPILHRHERILEAGEKMFQLQGRSINARVTGNHRFLVSERVNVGNQKEWLPCYEFMRADTLNLSAKRVKIPVSGVQESSGVRLTDEQIAFIGWFVTDGTLSGKRQQLTITQADHQPHIKDLRECLTGCGFDFRETKRQPTGFNSKPQTVFYIPKGTCKGRPRVGWKRLELYLDKNLSRNLDTMTERQFDIFIHAVHLGDGAKDRGNGSYRISTGNKTFADNLQGLAVRKGWKCNVSIHDGSSRLNPIYTLNMQKVSSTTIHGQEAATADDQVKLVESPSVPGVTKVWCVANELETLITRRNGMVAIIGNSWWRHGSLNIDREWELTMSSRRHAADRAERLREKIDKEPALCPECKRVLNGLKCQCGFVINPTAKTRPVIQHDGTLVQQKGDIFPARIRRERADTQKLWNTMYCRAYQGNMTFRQAEALFCHENYYWPPRTLALMPKTLDGWFRKVRELETDNLIGPFPGWLHDWRKKRETKT